MGYELTYHFHEKKDGSYNKEEVKTIKKKVGEPFEDIPLEKVAAAIMAQMARRDIFVINVDICELSKKQVSFKETDGGILIKNKKFSFDQSTVFVEMVEQPAITNLEPAIQPHQKISSKPPQKSNISQKSSLGKMTFLPELRDMNAVRNYHLTPEKDYSIFEKVKSKTGIGQDYKILNDLGKEITISENYFVPAKVNLLGDKEVGFSNARANEVDLQWSGIVEDEGPVLRR